MEEDSNFILNPPELKTVPSCMSCIFTIFYCFNKLRYLYQRSCDMFRVPFTRAIACLHICYKRAT